MSGRSRSEWSASIIVAIGGSASPYSIAKLSANGPRQFGTPARLLPTEHRHRRSLSNGVSNNSRLTSCARPNRQAVRRFARGHLLLQQVGLRLCCWRLQVGGRPPSRDAAFAVEFLQPLAHLHREHEPAVSLKTRRLLPLKTRSLSCIQWRPRWQTTVSCGRNHPGDHGPRRHALTSDGLVA